jgi:sugar-specific transcriptional regulator TrmB
LDVIDYSKSNSVFRIKYELKYLFFGFLLTASVSSLFIYIIIYLLDVEKTNKYNSFLTLFFLGICTFISVLLVSKNMRKIEIQKFKAVFIGIVFWFIGEVTYVTYQFILNIPVPYPSIAEVFYFLGYGFLIYHIYNSFKNIDKSVSINPKSIILVTIGVSLIPLITIIQMFEAGIDFSSQYIEIAINLLYYILDTIVLVLVILIIYKLPRKDPFIYHWLLFCFSMTLVTFADFGYTYTSTISEDLILTTEWAWNVIYAFAYLFLSAALIWYYKLTHLLNKDLDDTFNEDEKNRLDISLRGEHREVYEDDNYRPFRENIEDLSTIQKVIKELISNAKNEMIILFSSPDWLTKKEVQPIINILREKIHQNILIRLLIPTSVVNDEFLYNSLRENPNIMIRYFEKTLTTDSMILVVDLQKVIVWDTKTKNNKNNNNNNNKYFAIFTNKEESVFTYVSSFEKIWLLEKVMKCNLQEYNK